MFCDWKNFLMKFCWVVVIAIPHIAAEIHLETELPPTEDQGNGHNEVLWILLSLLELYWFVRLGYADGASIIHTYNRMKKGSQSAQKKKI